PEISRIDPSARSRRKHHARSVENNLSTRARSRRRSRSRWMNGSYRATHDPRDLFEAYVLLPICDFTTKARMGRVFTYRVPRVSSNRGRKREPMQQPLVETGMEDECTEAAPVTAELEIQNPRLAGALRKTDLRIAI